MCSIFEFLDHDYDMKGDLFNCSLVCSHWLYHVYNTPLLTIQVMDTLIEKTSGYDGNNINDNENMNDNISGGLRMWSRLTKLKTFNFSYFYEVEKPPNQLLLNKVLFLKNIKTLNGTCKKQHLAILKAIITQCREKIEHYSLHLDFDLTQEKNVLSPLVLPNAKYIEIHHLYLNIVWSNKCQTLNLFFMRDIDKNWCHFVIKNCDCSNIKCLKVLGKNFFKQDFTNVNQQEGKRSLKQFAQQFVNLKEFIIQLSIKFDDVLLLFCKYERIFLRPLPYWTIYS